MKIAIIADIHANLPALEAVLKDIQQQHVDEIWCLGDIVGYGPFPNECVHRVQETCSRVILGNHDERTSRIEKIEHVIKRTTDVYKAFVFRWTYEALGNKEKKYLRSLPQKDFIQIQQKSIALYHGSPDGINDAITCYTNQQRLKECVLKAKADIVLVAHSHEVLLQNIDGVLLLNPGSVGRPFNQILKASYAIIDIQEEVKTFFYSVDYCVEPCLLRMRQEGFPKELIEALAQAKSPSDVVPDDGKEELMIGAERLGKKFGLERKHALQVMHLSLKLFDGLQKVHQCSLIERKLLQAAAFLHDIGLKKGHDKHHKHSKDIILQALGWAVTTREQLMIALIARYHRKALPCKEHKDFLYLPDYHKVVVEKLSAILRIADGLDRSHDAYVQDLNVHLLEDIIEIELLTQHEVDLEIKFAVLKADLFEKVFLKKISFIQKKVF